MKGVTIRIASRGDFPALMEIWKACFGDSDEGTSFIFEKLQKPENMLVLTADGTPAAMLSVQPFTLISGSRECSAMYLYGVATLPEHQGKGYSTMLLDRAHDLCAERSAACSVLVPAEESLFGFYAKRGYKTTFRLNKAVVGADELEAGEIPELRPATAGELKRARREHFGDSGLFAEWDDEYLSFIVEDSLFQFWGGGVFAFEYEGGLCCVACHKREDDLYLKELAAPGSAIGPLLRALRDKFAVKRFVLYLREDVQTSYTNNLLPFGMVKWYDNMIESKMSGGGDGPAYIAHVLD